MGEDNPRYPEVAGAHEGSLSTAHEAAIKIEKSGRAASLRSRVLTWFNDCNEGTADECAEALEEHPLSIRPRVAEYHAQGLLVPTGERRKSMMKHSAMVMRSATAEELALKATEEVEEDHGQD